MERGTLAPVPAGVGEPAIGSLALEILATTPDVVAATTGDMSQLLYLSPAAETVYGRPRSEFAGNPSLWREVVHPADRPQLTDALQRLEIDGHYELNYRIQRPDGNVRWLLDQTHIQCGSDGIATRVFAVRRDITEQRREEESIRRNGRLTAIGTVAAGIAHEINNPLGAALLATETAISIQDRPEHRELLSLSLRSAVDSLNRCGAIIRNILRFARNERSEKTRGDLNQNVRQARDLSHQYADEHGVKIEARLDEALPPALLNSLEIQQVIVNLLHNAIQASKPGDKVSIFTRRSGDNVMLIVEDHGRGMSEEEQHHAFDPFFTTKQDCGGTGLGMSIIFAVVKDHQGRIHIETELGRGTTISVELPGLS